MHLLNQKQQINDCNDGFLIKLLQILIRNDDKILKKDFIEVFQGKGILQNDSRLYEILNQFSKKQKQNNQNQEYITKDEFLQAIQSNMQFIKKICCNQLVIEDFQHFCKDIIEIYNKVKLIDTGNVAKYIPQLQQVDPNLFAISICTIDGQRFNIGDSSYNFTLQSCAKPINYLIALQEHGHKVVHSYVGHEPSGQSFNEIFLNKQGLPHNPFINAGAIMICSLIGQKLDAGDRFQMLIEYWKRLSGGTQKIGYSNSTFLSEMETADRNFALAYFMKETNNQKQIGFPQDTNILQVLEFYFQTCSVEMNTQGMVTFKAIVAASLANGGINPLTNDQVFNPDLIKNCISLMSSCGMYDYSGQFFYKIGIPSKSGVSGCIWAVIPGKMGISIFSPKLDIYGNSIKGVEFFKELVRIYNFHIFDNVFSKNNGKIKKDISQSQQSFIEKNISTACYCACKGDLQELKRLYCIGIDLNEGNYDQRTPLHLAASEGHLNIVQFLIEIAHVDPNKTDRWGKSPYEDAINFKKQSIIQYLQKFI